ncbi:jerky-like protein [Trichonephila clavipes]|nr:jerky-like protein [Trichonephila clavipes]
MFPNVVGYLNEKLDGSADFKASTGWLKNIKSRHGIREMQIEFESLSGDKNSAHKFKETFLQHVEEGFSRSRGDVCNVDETGVNWKALPRKTLASKRETTALECDEDDVETRMACDAENWGFQMLNDDETATFVQEESDPVDDDTDEDESNNNNESSKSPSNADAFSALETAMEW